MGYNIRHNCRRKTKPLPSTIGVPNLFVAVVSIDTALINCIEGSNRDRSTLPRVYCGRQCLSKPVVSIDYAVPPRQAKHALDYQPITNDEELIDQLLSANVFQHVSETPRHQRLFIVRDSFSNKSRVPVDDPVPTLSSICCFLQGRPELDALDVADTFDKCDLPVFMDWSRLVGIVPRIYERVDRASYRARNEVNADGSSGGGGGGDMSDDGSYNSASFESDGDSVQCSTGLSDVR